MVVVLGMTVCAVGCKTHTPEPIELTAFETTVARLKNAFPDLFLTDAVIQERDDLTKPMVFGDPNPPEGFAGPDPTGRLAFGIYVPVARDGMFDTDISMEQWIVHEMFHLHNRRTREYDRFINEAFPTDDDPLVQWLMKDPYHRPFAREEAFINLITFADPARTDAQRSAVRGWFDAIGAKDRSLDEIQEAMRVIPHPPTSEYTEGESSRMADWTTETHIYKRVGDHSIHADATRFGDKKARPCVVWIHGGALIMGGRGANRATFAPYLDAGYVVVSIDYRLAPETKLPEIIEDLKDAFKWLRQNAQGLGIDAERLGVVGHSAGGYLTLMSGIAVFPRPRALVSYYGYGEIMGDWYAKPDAFYRRQPLVSEEDALADIGDVTISNGAGKGNRGRFYLRCRQQGTWLQEVGGFDPITQLEAFDPYCPNRHVSADYPPTFLLHGTADTDVPYEQSEIMAEALKSAGVAHEFYTAHDGHHGFDSNREDERSTEAQRRAISFLDAHVKG